MSNWLEQQVRAGNDHDRAMREAERELLDHEQWEDESEEYGERYDDTREVKDES